MPDLLVSAGVDVAALERDFQRAAQTAQAFAASLSRLNVVLPTPMIDVPAMERQGAVAGQAFSRGLGRGTKADDPYRDIVKTAERAASVIGAAFGVRAIVEAADEYQNVANKIRSVSTSAAAAAVAQTEVFRIAQLTRSEYDATATLFTRLTQASGSLGLSQANVLRLTQTINEALILGGGGAGESKRAVLDLAHGLAQGTLQARQLNQILAQAPALSKALAAGLGVPVDKLRELGHEGALSVKNVVQALLGISGTVDKEFAQTVPTIGNGLTQVATAFVNYIGQTSQASGAGRAVSASLRDVADNFDHVATAALAAGAVIVARSLGTPTTALLADTRAAITAFQDRRTAALGAAATDVEWARTSASASAVDRLAIEQRVASLALQRGALAASIDAQRAYLAQQAAIAAAPVSTRNALGQFRPNTAITADLTAQAAATTALGAANGKLFTTEVELERVEASLVADRTALAAATAAVGEAQAIVAVTGARLVAVQAETGIVATAAAAGSRLFSGALALVGGEVGAAILVIGGLVYWLNQQAEAAVRARHATDEFRQAIVGLPPLKVEADISAVQQSLHELEKMRANLVAKIARIPVPIVGEGRELSSAANPTAKLDAQLRLVTDAAARAKDELRLLTEQRDRLNTADGRTGLTSAATDAEIAQLTKLRDLGQLRVDQERRINTLVAAAMTERAQILAKPLPADDFGKSQVNARVLELTQEINDLTKQTKVDKQVAIKLRLDDREAAKDLTLFRDTAEATRVRLQLAVVLGAPDAEQNALVASLRTQYDAVASAVAAGNRPAEQQLALIKEQVSAARELQAVVLETASRASARVELAPALGFSPADHARAVDGLQRAYRGVVEEIAHMGGPLTASAELLREQVALAGQLGDKYAALLATPLPTITALVQPPDPRVVTELQAVRAALDDVTQARARVRLDDLAPPTFQNAAQFRADLAALEGASNAAAVQQRALREALAASSLSATEQRTVFAALESAYQGAGTSLDDLTARLAGLARASIGRVLAIDATITFPAVTVPVVPQIAVTFTKTDLERKISPLTATVQLRYVNAHAVDPALQQTIQRQIDAVAVAVTAANAAKTNVELKVSAKVDHASIAAAKREYDALAKAAKDATRDAQRSIAGLGAGEQQTTAAKDLDTAIGNTQVKAHHLTEEFIAGARALNEGLQAAGLLDAKTANIANSAITFAESLSKAITSKGLDVGADISALLAGFNVVKGIFGKSEIDKEHDAILRQNNEQLARLRSDLSGFTRTAAGLDATRRALASDTLIQQARNGGLSGLFGGTHPVLDEAALQRFGLTIGDLTTLAQTYGITLVDSKNRIIPESLTKLGDAVDLAVRKLFTWADTLTDLTDRQSLVNDVRDFNRTDSPAQAAQRIIDDAETVFSTLTKNVPELFDRIFGGIDLQSAGGRATLNDRLNSLITEELSAEFRDGRGWLADLLRKSGFESLADFNKWVLSLDHGIDAFDELNKSVTAATSAISNVPAAFKTLIDRARFEAQRPLLPPPAVPTPTPFAPRPPAPTPLPTPPAPTYVIYAPQFAGGAIVVSTAEDAATVLDKVNAAVIAEARGADGIHHPAAQGLMVALSRIPRRS